MAALTGITSVKQFTYRDDPTEQFSNTYHFRGPVPADDAAWKSLTTSLWAYEKAIFDSGTKMIEAIGYASDDPKAQAVWSWDALADSAAVTGTFVPGANERPCAGDQAATIAWMTDKKNTKGKTIYLRKYMHGAHVSTTDVDQLGATYQAAADAFAEAMCELGANFHGGVRSRRQDAAVTYAWADKWITTRTLKRRGKRPKPSP